MRRSGETTIALALSGTVVLSLLRRSEQPMLLVRVSTRRLVLRPQQLLRNWRGPDAQRQLLSGRLRRRRRRRHAWRRARLRQRRKRRGLRCGRAQRRPRVPGLRSWQKCARGQTSLPLRMPVSGRRRDQNIRGRRDGLPGGLQLSGTHGETMCRRQAAPATTLRGVRPPRQVMSARRAMWMCPWLLAMVAGRRLRWRRGPVLCQPGNGASWR